MTNSQKGPFFSTNLLQLLPFGWIKFAFDGKVISANPTIVKLLAFPDPMTFYQTNVWDLFADKLDSVQVQQCLEKQIDVLNFETELFCNNGNIVWVRLTIHPETDEQTNTPVLECIVEDISSFKNLEAELARAQATARKQHKLADVLGRMILSTSILQDLPSLLKLICSEAVVSMNVDSAQIWLLQENNLVGVAAVGPGQEIINGLKIPLSNIGHIGIQALNKKIPLYLSDLHGNSIIIHSKFKDSIQLNSILATPLLIAGRAIGVLLLVDEKRNRTFDGDDLEFSLLLGNQAAIVVENVRMFNSLKIANTNIAGAYDATLVGWAKALELRDLETEGHTQRVTKLTLDLAKKFGVDSEGLTQIYRGALLHDIGKMGIPDDILLKPGPLNETELEIMRRHPTYAYEMLKPIEYLQSSLDIPYCHHEKWDGSGYPQGLKGEEIPFFARIFAVVDVWDALNSNRPYREAWSREGILELMRENSGKQFDPQVVDKFFEIVPYWD